MHQTSAIIYDIGTSKIIHAEAMLARQFGQKIPEDSAFNANGESTTDPQEALDGALAVWGAQKGAVSPWRYNCWVYWLDRQRSRRK